MPKTAPGISHSPSLASSLLSHTGGKQMCVQFAGPFNSVPFRTHKVSVLTKGSVGVALQTPSCSPLKQWGGTGHCRARWRLRPPCPEGTNAAFQVRAVTQSFFQLYLRDETRWESEGGGDCGSLDPFRVCGKGFFLHLGNKCALKKFKV